jgi:hypothetical protein
MAADSTATTALLGVAGAAVPEVMRVIAALRAGKPPARLEILASLLSIMLGLGVLLFNTSGDSHLQIAVFGAAFPQLFSGLVAAAKPPSEASFRGPISEPPGKRPRTLWDYLAWQL